MPQMRSRREQVEAHRFITSRMNQALVLANPDSIERPLRRIGVSIFASVMVLALIFGGFAIATLFNKGNALPEPGAIITIKGSNSVYVYTTKSGGEETEDDKLRLWQVTNYTSALLLAKPGSNGKPQVQDLKASSLAGIARGSFTIGIQGIPTQPPSPEELLQKQDWNACSIPRRDNGTTSFQLTQLAVMDLEAPDKELSDDTWMLVKTAVDESQVEAEYYLLWNGAKYGIGDDDRPASKVIDDLGLSVNDAVPLDAAMLRAIPTGPPLAPEIRPEFGETSEEGVTAFDGTPLTYGRPVSESDNLYVLVKTENDGDEFAEITPTMEALLKTQYGATIEIDPIDRSDIGATATYLPPDYPVEYLGKNPWTTDASRPAVCAVYSEEAQKEGDTSISIAMYEQAPDELTDAAESVEFTDEGEIFSQVEGMVAQTVLPQGMAVLADARTDEGGTISGFTYMVSDQGFRHGIIDQGITDSTQKLLGYDGVDAVSVPDTMISLIPEGPSLDPYEARKQMAVDADDVPVYETESESPAAGG
ncbi:type VII secretion protein EccB [Glycomyces sp. A-F 0318]|uniref:type VII secretion protein EccB n=1 Tax=Glycomyces amatae TaxID=2881355 RepID=UPI001E5A24BD|nr:type VII secretion protein EccB [Glycomyces amatae]MCD0445496.1 type VII secretion protein EccB [Glycomyces amatae]